MLHGHDEDAVDSSIEERQAPSWLGDIDDDDNAATAILVAAAQLFSERSPSKVTLREIADRAGVNYGLIHHYYGTKDAILSQLIRRSSEAAASNMRDAASLEEALDALVDVSSDGAHIRMLAWVLLSETDATRSFGASPAIRHLTKIAASTGTDDPDAKVLAAVLVSAIMGWQMFRPFLTSAAELDDGEPQALNAAVYEMVRRFGAAAASSPT